VSGLGPQPRKKLQTFVELIDGLGDVIAGGASVAETIIQIVDRSGLRAKLEADDSSESRDRLDNLAELVSTATDFEDEGGAGEDGQTSGIDDFLERIALTAPADQSVNAAVVLMTIHIAKGLEWPIVFISGLEDGLFPSLREREGTSEDAALEEERRLAYVAITRSRERLVLTHARTRRVWGEIRIQTPSRFLDDLPPGSLSNPARPRTQVPKGPRIVEGNFAPRRDFQKRRQRFGQGSNDFDQRVEDDEPVYNVDDDSRTALRGSFAIGAAVYHDVLGTGRVVAVSGTGRLIVEFANIGQKTVDAQYLHAREDGLN
jgi:DNA helicase-2/ATP-dependent DNA helicase PcrA